MGYSPVEHKIAEIVTDTLAHEGYELVRVRLGEQSSRMTLQLMAERTDGKGMTVDDCTEISHLVSALLDVHDPIAGKYHLEVSSPGVDRPLMRHADYVRYAGFEVKLETILPIEGRKRFRGRIESINDDDEIKISVDNTEYLIPLKDVDNAKLVMTDELLKAWQDGKVGH